MLGGEVLLLQSASVADGFRAEVDHRPAELPVIYVGALDVLGGGGGSPVLPVPARCRDLRGTDERGLHLTAVWRQSLSVRPRGGEGSRQADRRLHGQLCAYRWG